VRKRSRTTSSRRAVRFYWPERPDREDDTDPDQPGLDGVVEYLYEGNGRATYVGGQLEGS
jgi:hypothetical protein